MFFFEVYVLYDKLMWQLLIGGTNIPFYATTIEKLYSHKCMKKFHFLG